MEYERKRPLVSAVVPVYKTAENYLRCCIESMLNQTLQNFQIILVDDGSPDDCGKICDEYAAKDSRVEVYHKENGGASSARNVGIQYVCGEYLTFVDSDDTLLANAWEEVVSCMDKEQADCTVFGWYMNHNSPHEENQVCLTKEIRSAVDVMRIIAGDNDACGGGYPWNKMWRTDSIRRENNGLIPLFDIELFAYEDKHWILRVLKGLRKVCLMPEILYDYRYVQDSQTNSDTGWHKRQFNAYKAYDMICDYLQTIDNSAYRSAIRKYFQFCFTDVRNQYAWRDADPEWFHDSEMALLRLCKRIRFGDLHGLKYNLAWLSCLIVLGFRGCKC